MHKYRLVNWEFDTARFASAIREMHNHFSYGEMSTITGMSKSTLNNWANENFSTDFPHPHMSNLLIICNHLDLDPRDFFILEDL